MQREAIHLCLLALLSLILQGVSNWQLDARSDNMRWETAAESKKKKALIGVEACLLAADNSSLLSSSPCLSTSAALGQIWDAKS